MKPTERSFWLDSGLFIVFLSTTITGTFLWLIIPHQTAAVFLGYNRDFWRYVHICSGLASAAGNVTHVIWHRDWLKALSKRPMASLPSKLRVNRVVDRFIWINFLVASAFGALDWALPGETLGSLSSRLHLVFGLAWLLGITAHLVLHKKWITSASLRCLRVKEAYGANFSNN
jgi:hypothetical protein